MSQFRLRQGNADDQASAYYVCLKTGDHGRDGQPYYLEDPDALGRIYVGPYLQFEPELSLILEDDTGVCGYALAALDSQDFYRRYEQSWRPDLCQHFAAPQGDSNSWTRVERVYSCYHRPDYFCPEPYAVYPSHMHIDLLERARGQGWGRRMMESIMGKLRERGSPGVHLGVSIRNEPAISFYHRIGFHKLCCTGSSTDGCVYLGKQLRPVN